MIHESALVSPDAKLGENVKVWHVAQIREGAKIGDNCNIAKGVYIDFGVKVGNNCKIQNNSSLYNGCELEDGVFIGPHCILTNDRNPRAITPEGEVKQAAQWRKDKILIKEGASLGARTVVVAGNTVGRFALIGAGSVVTKDIPDFALAYGNPAEVVGWVDKAGNRVEKNPESEI